MKQFIFNENKRCINPNRYPLGNKDFYGEILTACSQGKWFYGFWYWSKEVYFNDGVYIDTYTFNTENEAIMKGTEVMAVCLDQSVKRSRMEVPTTFFAELKDLYFKCKNPQQNLF